jgi:hypothetical protein
MTSFAFSCVVDDVPVLLAQTFIWVNCLKRLQSINPRDIFVHIVEVQNSEFLNWLQAEQVNVVTVERFDRRSPHCNKIQQLSTFAGAAYDQIVLMDCDTAWVGTAELPIGAPVASRIVDAANPPERILLNIFNAAGLGTPKWTRVGFPMGNGFDFTDANNCNGGLYICDREFVAKLDRLWRFWALWCLDRSELFERFAVHADQVSFALAMRELRANVRHLPVAWNYPTHLRLDGLPDVSPEIIHYHRDLTAALKLKTVGVPSVDASIGHLNDGIEHFPREAWLDTLLQNFGDGIGPDLGAGAQPHDVAAAAPAPGSGSAAARGTKFATRRPQPGKVVVGSGWWCDEKPHDWAIGSPVTRSVPFFDLWYRQVVRCLQPDRIVVTDSASPIKPDYHSYPIQWIELDRNYGQPNDIRIGRIATKYSGFTRGVINGATYALCCDADFYVYVEQDCLLHGEDFLGAALGDSSADIFLGAPTENGRGIGGGTAAAMLQQSLIIVRRAGLERFLEGLLGAPWTDGEVSPEEIMRRRLAPFDFIQVPYGRSRPIDFARPHFYAQHLDDDELRQFVADAGSAAVDQIPPVPVSAKQPQIPISRATAPAHQIDGVLRRELDAWARAGLTARFWLRDDDAVSDTEELRRLLGLAQEVGITIALAAIPDRADASLARLVADAPCCVWQHGYRHDWRDERECEEFTKGEFGEGRLLKAMTDDAEQGQRALDRVFGPAGWQRVFVPPFHALSISFKAMLPSLGYWGVSAGCPLTPRLDAVAEVNADIDIMNWPEQRFMGADSTGAMLVEQLKLRRTGSLPVDRPIGLLTHHPALDDDAWRFLEQLLPFLRSHPSVEFLPVEALFRPSGPAVEASTAPGSAAAQQLADDVTVVITSCNRQDLLEATLDSFLRCNTFPIRQFIVIEDGDGANNQRLIEKYRDLPFTWLATADRVGQVAAIDIAYSEISTDFIFHCEDDWEFTSPGFIEKSLCILKHDDQILQVWLRALTDTNRQPVFDHMFEVEGVHYKVLRHHHDAGEFGTWHGFSWNPALRRRREYDLLGSFTSLDPNGLKQTWEVESAASEFYQKRAFFAAILADNNGMGYVRHLGGGRRVPRLPIMAQQPPARSSTRPFTTAF